VVGGALWKWPQQIDWQMRSSDWEQVFDSDPPSIPTILFPEAVTSESKAKQFTWVALNKPSSGANLQVQTR
jgi:hypothetical protein